MESPNCKTLVVVGNGGSTLNCKNGRFIDNCDVVIRIKKFVLEGFEEFVGTKTDIWAMKWFCYDSILFKKIWLPFLDPNSEIVNPSIKLMNEFMFKNQFDNRAGELYEHNRLVDIVGRNKIELLKEPELVKCLDDLKLTYQLVYTKSGINVYHPTTYLLAIFLALERFPTHKIYVTGCDNFEQGYYWNLNEAKRLTKTWPHQYEKERLFLKKLVLTNKVTLIT